MLSIPVGSYIEFSAGQTETTSVQVTINGTAITAIEGGAVIMNGFTAEEGLTSIDFLG